MHSVLMLLQRSVSAEPLWCYTKLHCQNSETSVQHFLNSFSSFGWSKYKFSTTLGHFCHLSNTTIWIHWYSAYKPKKFTMALKKFTIRSMRNNYLLWSWALVMVALVLEPILMQPAVLQLWVNWPTFALRAQVVLFPTRLALFFLQSRLSK